MTGSGATKPGELTHWMVATACCIGCTLAIVLLLFLPSGGTKAPPELAHMPESRSENGYRRQFVGENVPSVELLSGSTVTLESLTEPVLVVHSATTVRLSNSWISRQRRPILMNFWGTWCKPCIDEMDLLNELASKYQQSVIFAGVAYELDLRDPKIRVIERLKQHGIDYANYLVLNENLGRLVFRKKQLSYPAFALFDETGTLRFVLEGSLKVDDGRERLELALAAVLAERELDRRQHATNEGDSRESEPSGAGELSPEEASELSPDEVAKLSPDEVAKLSPEVAELSPDEVAELSPEEAPDEAAELPPDEIEPTQTSLEEVGSPRSQPSLLEPTFAKTEREDNATSATAKALVECLRPQGRPSSEVATNKAHLIGAIAPVVEDYLSSLLRKINVPSIAISSPLALKYAANDFGASAFNDMLHDLQKFGREGAVGAAGNALVAYVDPTCSACEEVLSLVASIEDSCGVKLRLTILLVQEPAVLRETALLEALRSSHPDVYDEIASDAIALLARGDKVSFEALWDSIVAHGVSLEEADLSEASSVVEKRTALMRVAPPALFYGRYLLKKDKRWAYFNPTKDQLHLTVALSVAILETENRHGA